MRWIWIVVAVAVCILCGLVGFTIGVNLNADSSTRYVLNWGSLGDWVSGLGALLAIATTLYLTKRNEAQQEDAKKDVILVEQDATDWIVSIRCISMGSFPTTIRAVMFVRDDGGAVRLSSQTTGQHEPEIPCRLEFKQDLHFSWRIDVMRQLVMALGILQCRRLEDLQLLIATSTQEFRFPLDSKICDAIRGIARANGVQIETEPPA